MYKKLILKLVDQIDDDAYLRKIWIILKKHVEIEKERMDCDGLQKATD